MHIHKHQLYLLEQHSESFKIWSAIIRINTEGTSLIMKLGPDCFTLLVLVYMFMTQWQWYLWVGYFSIVLPCSRYGFLGIFQYRIAKQSIWVSGAISVSYSHAVNMGFWGYFSIVLPRSQYGFLPPPSYAIWHFITHHMIKTK